MALQLEEQGTRGLPGVQLTQTRKGLGTLRGPLSGDRSSEVGGITCYFLAAQKHSLARRRPFTVLDCRSRL